MAAMRIVVAVLLAGSFLRPANSAPAEKAGEKHVHSEMHAHSSKSGMEAEKSRPSESELKARSLKYLEYLETIELTPKQRAIKEKALGAIPAPCCSDYPILTCCCPCNLAKVTWGLSHYLIAKKGYGVERVRREVRNWLKSVNPDGFTGDACSQPGGCQRPFARNGCGGMKRSRIRF